MLKIFLDFLKVNIVKKFGQEKKTQNLLSK